MRDANARLGPWLARATVVAIAHVMSKRPPSIALGLGAVHPGFRSARARPEIDAARPPATSKPWSLNSLEDVMKKTYEKPVLSKRGKLAAVTASSVTLIWVPS